MVTSYTTISLGRKATQYITECLSNGKILSHLALQAHDLTTGQIKTYLPSFVDNDQATDFRSGGKFSKDTPLEKLTSQTDLWLISEILFFLSGRNNRICIFEHSLAEPKDEWIVLEKPQIFTYVDDVYFFLLSKDASEKAIERTIRNVTTYLFIGFLASMPEGWTLPAPGQVVTKDDLQSYAQATQKIVVGAYDGEGYVICDIGTKSMM